MFDHLPHAGCLWLGAEVGEDPGCPGPLPRVELRARLEVDDDVEPVLIVASLLGDLVDELGQCLWGWQLDREDAVPARRAAERPAVRPACRDPDRDPRRLHGSRLELPGPKLGQAAEPMIESLCAFARVDDLAEALELGVAVAAEPQSLGVGGDRAESDPKVGDSADGRPVEDVVPEEEAVPTLLLGLYRQRDERPRIGELVERRQVEPSSKPAIRTHALIQHLLLDCRCGQARWER